MILKWLAFLYSPDCPLVLGPFLLMKLAPRLVRLGDFPSNVELLSSIAKQDIIGRRA